MSRRVIPSPVEWAAAAEVRSAYELAVLIAIARLVHRESGQAQARKASLAQAARISVETLKRTLAAMTERGRGLLAVTAVVSPGGGWETSVYTLVGWLRLRGLSGGLAEGVVEVLAAPAAAPDTAPLGSVRPHPLGSNRPDPRVSETLPSGLRDPTPPRPLSILGSENLYGSPHCLTSLPSVEMSEPPAAAVNAGAGGRVAMAVWADRVKALVAELGDACEHRGGFHAGPLISLCEPKAGEPCDWEADVLPAIREVAAREQGRGKRIFSFAFPAITERAVRNRDQRLAPLPASQRRAEDGFANGSGRVSRGGDGPSRNAGPASLADIVARRHVRGPH